MELESLLSEPVTVRGLVRTVGERVTLGDLASLEVSCVKTRLRRKSVPKYLLSLMSWREKKVSSLPSVGTRLRMGALG